MLYKFKSQAAAEVIMLQPDAETLLKIIGKSPGAQGIVTVQQVPAAVAALRQAIAAQKQAASAPAAQKNDARDEEDSRDEGVSLERRAAPFITLLERSAAEGKDVVWGV
jgi:cyclopropane-fatty-acyl-phospholipid synthase